jgi:GDP-L-fucose synthase
VLPALIRRFHEAKQLRSDKVTIWGSGTPRREFLHVDDMADASLHVMELARDVYDANTSITLSHINVGTGEDLTIREAADVIRSVVGFEGSIDFDRSRPDGTPRKLMDTGKLRALGWQPKVGFRVGIAATYAAFKDEVLAMKNAA